MCKNCSGFSGRTEVDEKVTLDGDVINKVAEFLYLGNVLSSEGGGLEKAVIVRII